MTSKSKRDMLVRVDKAAWLEARQKAGHPSLSDREISKILFDTSIIKYKDTIGNFIYGKNNWNRMFYEKKNQ